MTAAELLELAACAETEIIDVAGLGKVRIRPLRGSEVVHIGRIKNGGDEDAAAAFMVHKALVDPALSLEQAGQFQATAAYGPWEALISAISNLSGLTEGAQKSGGTAVPPGGA